MVITIDIDKGDKNNCFYMTQILRKTFQCFFILQGNFRSVILNMVMNKITGANFVGEYSSKDILKS